MILVKEKFDKYEAEIRTVLSYESTRKNWKNKFESKEFKAAEAIGSKVGSPLNRSVNCGCIDDLFVVLKLIIKNNNKLKPLEMKNENRKFNLKEGKMIQVHGFAPVTNDNLTDEKAVELLAKYPALIGQFANHPDNWKKQCEEFKKASGKKTTEAAEEVKTKTSEEKTSEEVGTEGSGEESTEGGEAEKTREEELKEATPEVLRVIADSLFESGKAAKKAGIRSKPETLVAYILKNEKK